eukprot:TRINITY_DN2163_c0_g1_i2.p1 TRINITY_DN2163_c0_g1~~TRINITY_DN2163_c0_g1_i2.p1  ORF type:complete len:203 (+),score=26.66 TRINITY_DN2163_c0_g1_i2:224-832(+)
MFRFPSFNLYCFALLGVVKRFGDPVLRQKAAFVEDVTTAKADCDLLGGQLEEFRKKHGFGRGMSAPQVGVSKRIIALNLGSGTFFVFNPEITDRSSETFTMWDDCMSLPSVMVRVKRHKSISLRYTDEKGDSVHWKKLDAAISELLQHEIDHLDGVLMTDRAYGEDSIIDRELYLLNREFFDSQVDYKIVPTINKTANSSSE